MALLRQGRDLILFDQRGSGRSEESLCPDLAKSLSAIGSEGLGPAEEGARERAEFAKCKTQLEAEGRDLNAYTTRETVADMEAIRRAFGVTKWNLAAISYGSLVALDAMRTTPDSIRSSTDADHSCAHPSFSSLLFGWRPRSPQRRDWVAIASRTPRRALIALGKGPAFQSNTGERLYSYQSRKASRRLAPNG